MGPCAKAQAMTFDVAGLEALRAELKRTRRWPAY